MLILRKIYRVLRNNIKQSALMDLLKQNAFLCFYNAQNFSPDKSASLKTTLYFSDTKFVCFSGVLLKRLLLKIKYVIPAPFVNRLFFGSLLVFSFNQNSPVVLFTAHKLIFNSLISDRQSFFPLFNYTFDKFLNFSDFYTHLFLRKNIFLSFFVTLLCYHTYFSVLLAHIRYLIFLL